MRELMSKWGYVIGVREPIGGDTVSNKTVPITNPNTVRKAHCNHMWEFHLAFV